MADWIEWHLGPMGYSTSVQNLFNMKINSSACPDYIDGGLPGNIGTLACTRGPGVPSTTTVYGYNPGGYLYGAICAESATYLGNIVACSTHLYYGSGLGAVGQAEDLRQYASFAYPGTKKILLGDFNLRPPGHGGTPVPPGYYANYYEADGSLNRPTRDSGGGPSKNDFMFGAKNSFPCGGGAWPPTQTQYSDHFYYRGLFCS